MQLINIIVVGVQDSGKTQLINRFINNDYVENKFIKGMLGTKNVEAIDHTKLQISVNEWNYLANKSEMPSICYGKKVAALLCINVTKDNSLKMAQEILAKMKANIPEDFIVVLVATKAEEPQKWKITEEMLKEFARAEDLPLVVTSAKIGMGVDNAFYTLAEKVMLLHSGKAVVIKR